MSPRSWGARWRRSGGSTVIETPQPEPTIVEKAEVAVTEPVEVPAEEDLLSGEDALAWLESLTVGKRRGTAPASRTGVSRARCRDSGPQAAGRGSKLRPCRRCRLRRSHRDLEGVTTRDPLPRGACHA